MFTELIMFGEDWGRHPSSTQMLAQALVAQGQRVLWVNSIGLRRPRLTRHDLQRAYEKMRAFLSRKHQVNDPQFLENSPSKIFRPMSIPWYSSGWARTLNTYLLRHLLRELVVEGAAMPDRTRVSWTSLPSTVDMVGTLQEDVSIYYCCDDFGSLAGVDHGAILEMEKELAEKVSLVLLANPGLADRFDPKKTYLLPHGVDSSFLGVEPVPRPLDLPRDGKPVLGYYGSIASWFHIELLGEVARALPECHLVLIGNVSVELGELMQMDNVHTLGPRPHSSLKGYVQHWQVSLIPFRDVDQVKAASPVKLYEYLALGAPIVSTSFPAVEVYREHVCIADSARDFIDGIRAALVDPGDAMARRRLVAGHTWRERANRVVEILEKVTAGDPRSASASEIRS